MIDIKVFNLKLTEKELDTLLGCMNFVLAKMQANGSVNFSERRLLFKILRSKIWDLLTTKEKE